MQCLLRVHLGAMGKNNYFEMKQMRIEQKDCAMKVSTDACILGAWTPIPSLCKNILDIGAGTGLLSLMLAQRNENVQIDAIEIEPKAAAEATLNVSNSKFEKQIKIHQQNISSWQGDKKYELIICNPPFFSNSLRSENEQRKLARHNDFLNPKALSEAISKYLSPNGYASILIPTSEELVFGNAFSESKLFTAKRLLIKPFGHSFANRAVYYLSKIAPEIITDETLIIYEKEKTYSDNFSLLMKPFYLHL